MMFAGIRLSSLCFYLLLGITLTFSPIAFAQEHRAEKDKQHNYISSGSFEGGEITDGLDVKEMMSSPRI